MKLATRLAILCGSALVAILLAAMLFTFETSRIAELYDQRAEARSSQVISLEVGRDLQTFFATFNRVLLVNDPARDADLAATLDDLDAGIENELRSAADTDSDGATRMQYQQALTTWGTFQTDYRAELDRVRIDGNAAGSARGLDDQMELLGNQIAQVEQQKARAVEVSNERAAQAIQTSKMVVWVFSGVLVAVLGVLLFLTSRNIHRTVTRSAEQSEKARLSKEIQANLMTEIQGTADLAAAGGIIVSRTAQALGAKHGALYLRRAGSEQVGDAGRYALTASYAFHRRKGLPGSYGLGDGLVGQCALEGTRIEVTGAPGDYVEIVSGLGKTEPVSLILIPIKFESEVLGVLELAGLRLFDDEDIDLLESIALGAGVALSAIESAQKTRELLQISQAQTEELQTQEEELRAANEQLAQREDLLSAQNAELEETTEELRSQQEELRASSERLESQAQSLEEKNGELQRLSGSLEARAEELAVSSRYKSEFLANMSHELRTPLNSILILAGLLTESDEPISEKQHEFAETIQQSGKDLLNLIDEVLDLAKVESGSLRLEKESIHTAELVSFLERTFRPIAEDKGVAYRVVVGETAPEELTSDYTRVKQIAKNLVANAIKFTDEGAVTVQLFGAADMAGSPGGRYLGLAVVDTGIGIDEKDHNLVFESFQQAARGTTRQYGGTGLGLAISRELARNLGGDIALRSALGKGSTFTCYLPVGEALDGAAQNGQSPPNRAVPSSIPTRASLPLGPAGNGYPAEDVPDGARFGAVDISDITWPQGAKPVLLIVEDDATFAGMLAGLATEAGFDSVITPSGRVALALAKERRPAAITLDIGLPDMAGWVVLDVLKHDLATRHIPVNVISGTNDDGRGRRMGAIQTLNKPADLSELRLMFSATADFLKPGPRHVLVAEDDANQRQVVKHMIESDDIAITCVSNGEQVLAELAGPTTYDCLVLDLGLPDIDGIDLIERIKDQLKQRSLPVIVHTGRELTAAETERLEALAAAIVLKNAKSPERLLDETALFLHRVANDMPDSARKILSNPRRIDESLEGHTVLLVDDDVRNVFSLGSALKRYGITVLPARNGQAGLDSLAAHPEVGLVLMDIMMPVMDGYEAMRRIRAEARWRSLPIVALTAKAMKGDRQKCLDAGASDYVTKPVDMDQLTSVLRGLAGQSAARVARNVRELSTVPGQLPESAGSRELALIEADAFFYAVYEYLGYDFRHYSDASRNRRLASFVDRRSLGTISQAQSRVLRDPELLAELLSAMTVNVTEMFRDPMVFAKIRAEVLPRLATYPRIRIWIAGCATGEEAYSMAILLDEAGLLNRTTMYATDIDSESLRVATSAIYPAEAMVRATRNYQASGGQRPFSDWYIAKYDRCILSPDLRSPLEFFSHNLATDAAFGEFNLIMCRNVFIYFEDTLQRRVERVFRESLSPFGNLIIGPREGLTGEGLNLFTPLDRRLGIYAPSQTHRVRP